MADEEEEEQEEEEKEEKEPKDEDEGTPFEKKFKDFAADGDPKNEGENITLASIAKWLKRANIKKIGLPEATEAFKAVAKTKFSLTKEEFEEFLKNVTEAAEVDLDEVKELLTDAESPEMKKKPEDEIPRLDHCAPGAIPAVCVDAITAASGKRTPLEPCRPGSANSRKKEDPCKPQTPEPAKATESSPSRTPITSSSLIPEEATKIAPCNADCQEQGKMLPPCNPKSPPKTGAQAKKSTKK